MFKRLLVSVFACALTICLTVSLAACVNFTPYEEHSHNYDQCEVLTAPTENTAGEAKITCSGCDVWVDGHTMIVELPALSDEAYSMSFVSEPDCDAAGEVKYTYVYSGVRLYFTVAVDALGHDYGEWIEEVPATEEAAGVKDHYECVRCGKLFDADHKEVFEADLVIEQLQPEVPEELGVITEDQTYIVGEDLVGSYDAKLKLDNGILMMAAADGTVSVDANNKSIDGYSFTHRIKLGGAIRSGYRYIEVVVGGAATIDVYAMSSSGSEDRVLNLYGSLEDLTETGIMKGNTALGKSISKLSYNVNEAGEYFLGSAAGGINVYAIVVTMGGGQQSEEPEQPEQPVVVNVTINWNYEGAPEATVVTYTDGVAGSVITVPAREGYALKGYSLTADGEVLAAIDAFDKDTAVYAIWGESQQVVDYENVYYKVGAVASEDLNAENGYVVADGAILIKGGYNSSNSAYISIDSNSKTYGEGESAITFTNRVKLGGAMSDKSKNDSRYIAITVQGPCKVIVYCMSSSSDTVRTVNVYKANAFTADNLVTSIENVGGAALQAIELTFTEAGTYYIGSEKDGLNVYGISIIY